MDSLSLRSPVQSQGMLLELVPFPLPEVELEVACLACSDFDHRDRPRGEAVLEAVKSVSKAEAAASPRTIITTAMLGVRGEDRNNSWTICSKRP